MKGWEMKPLGWVAVLALIVLIVYIGFGVLTQLRPSRPAI